MLASTVLLVDEQRLAPLVPTSRPIRYHHALSLALPLSSPRSRHVSLRLR